MTDDSPNTARNKTARCSALLVPVLLIFTGLTGCGPKLQLTPLEPPPEPVTGSNGMVVAAQPLAAEAGLAVLDEGGNAIDAALAALFMLNVVEPHASGLGGGGFALVRTAQGESRVVIFRERAPRNVDTSFYYDPADTSGLRMTYGGTAVCTPGAAAGWAELYDRWGTMPLERLARDAVSAAREGFPVDPVLAAQIGNNIEKITADSAMAATFLKDGVLPYAVGDTLRQEALAKTIEFLVKHGLRAFYRGPVAEDIVDAVQSDGGKLGLDDFAFYRAEVAAPVVRQWRGYTLLTVPPPSSGGAALAEILSLFDRSDATSHPQGSPQAVHIMSQCIQQGYADAAAVIEDTPEALHNWQRMLNPAQLERAVAGIALKAKPGPRAPVAPPDMSHAGNTTHLVVIDKDGNCVSLTQSINWFFGAGVMGKRSGILLNNQMSDFSRPPESLNLLEPRKRPRSNMTPVIMLQDGEPVLLVGTPGGARIPAATAQIITDVFAWDMDIAAAIDYPRFFPVREHLVLENRYPLKVLKKLKKFGYTLHLAGPYHTYFGGAHGIQRDPRGGGLLGAADKRRGGAARGF